MNNDLFSAYRTFTKIFRAFMFWSASMKTFKFSMRISNDLLQMRTTEMQELKKHFPLKERKVQSSSRRQENPALTSSKDDFACM